MIAEASWKSRCPPLRNKDSVSVIYLHQEGRGIGLMAKLKAYALQ